MPNPGLSDDDCLAVMAALAAHDGNQTAAARALNMDRGTFRHRLAVAQLRDTAAPEPAAEEEPLDPEDLPSYAKVKRRLDAYNADHIRKTEASRSVTLKMPHGPVLLWFIGDLHLDSPGFDDRQFYADLDTIRAAQDEFGQSCKSVFMGDVLDNWPLAGKLGKKNHDSHLTRKEALALVRGLFQEEGIDWAAVLLGNHDHWAGVDFETLLRQWCPAPILDWAAYLTVATRKGWGFNVFLAHDMAGHSMYNQVHGLSRRAREDGTADLYVAAHRHHTGQGQEYNGHRDRTFHMLRVGSYKRADEYAHRRGYPEAGPEGATALAVLDPNATTQDGRCFTFYDLSLGVDFARMLRDRG